MLRAASGEHGLPTTIKDYQFHILLCLQNLNHVRVSRMHPKFSQISTTYKCVQRRMCSTFVSKPHKLFLLRLRHADKWAIAHSPLCSSLTILISNLLLVSAHNDKSMIKIQVDAQNLTMKELQEHYMAALSLDFLRSSCKYDDVLNVSSWFWYIFFFSSAPNKHDYWCLQTRKSIDDWTGWEPRTSNLLQKIGLRNGRQLHWFHAWCSRQNPSTGYNLKKKSREIRRECKP